VSQLVGMRFVAVLAAALLAGVASGDDDGASACGKCQSTIAVLQEEWTNATEVAEILASLEQNCTATFGRLHPLKVGLCDKVAEVFVQIPPGIFQGLETLAWPIPLGVCATIGECETPCCEAGAPPEQIHLSLAGNDASRMGVTWTTLEPRAASIVEYGPVGAGDGSVEPTAISRANGTVETYRWGGWVGSIHRAAMEGLDSGAQYAYRVGDGSDGGWSTNADGGAWVVFRTLPPAAAFKEQLRKEGEKEEDEEEELSVTFAVVADMGYGSTSDDTVANLAALTAAGNISGVIHSGDVSYADGFMPHWDAFLNKVQPIASVVPYMTTPGNHELWYNFSAYKHRFLMPGTPPLAPGTPGISASGEDGMYYAWGVPGVANFLALDSETPYDTAKFGPSQRSWMDAELASADENREDRPWSVAHFHRPLYCSNNHQDCFQFAPVLRAEAEDIFLKNNLDLVLNGHVHDYERTYPTAHGNATQHGYDYSSSDVDHAPTYVTQGASGNREGNSGFSDDLPDWSAGHSSVVGFGLLTMSRSALAWRFFNATPAGPLLLDSFTMTR
jgi:hypothetical protein